MSSKPKGYGGRVGPPTGSQQGKVDADLPWMKLAQCRGGVDWTDFYCDMADKPAVRRAKNVCQRCPVRKECLKFATETKDVNGIWGGKTPWERGVR